MSQVVSYVEIDVPHCSLTYSVAPCTASLVSSPPTGTIKCFNSLGTCQDRANFTDVPVTFRFCEDLGQLRADIEAYPFIKTVDFQPAIISLGGDLGQRATLKVTFKDAPHSDAGNNFDKYPADRNYTDPFSRGTFWGKFRARNPFLRGRFIRLYRGTIEQQIAEMDEHHFIIESIDGPGTDGLFSIVAKDILKLADGDRSVAPLLSPGFLVADITNSQGSLTLSPAGVGNTDYPGTGYVAIGGKEIVSYNRDIYTVLLLDFDGTDASTVFTDTAREKTVTVVGNAQIDTAQFKFGTASGLFDGSGDYLTLDGSADFTFGTGDFTIEFFVRFNSVGAQKALIDFRPSAGNGNYPYIFRSSGNVLIYFNNSSNRITGTTTVTTGTWYHVALARSGTSTKLFLNGTQEGSTYTDSSAYAVGASRPTIATDGNNTAATNFDGWIDNLRVQKGIATYTGNFTAPVTPVGLTNTGDVMQIHRAKLNTEAQAASASDRVQLVLQYSGEDGADIIADLLETYAGVSATYIPLTEWLVETATYLGTVYTLNLPEPTSVAQLVAEMIEQMGAALWWDDSAEKIRLQVLRGIPTTAERWNEDNVIVATLDVREQPDSRISQVLGYFGQINPLLKRDETSNYRSTASVIDAQSEIDEGTAAIKKIFARGIAQGGRTVAETMANKYLGRYVRPPRRFNFELLRFSGVNPTLGGGFRLGGGVPQISSWPFQDETGDRVDIPIQVTRLNPMADRFIIEAEEMLASGGVTNPNDRIIIFDANEFNINLRTRHDELFDEPQSGNTVTAYVYSGIIIGSSSTTLPAFDIGTWPGGVTVTLIILGRIQGAGGKGGGVVDGNQNGSSGGTALYSRQAITLDLTNAGADIWGGGGGGASNGFFDGGGGGAGYVPGAGGNGGGGVSGSPGTTEAGGNGVFPGVGNGGGPGLAGMNSGPQTGGAAGAAIDGVSFCTISSPDGDIRGGQIN